MPRETMDSIGRDLEQKTKIAIAIVGICVLSLCTSAEAQSTFGSIVGVVRDTTQAVVPGAQVKVKSLDDDSVRTAGYGERRTGRLSF